MIPLVCMIETQTLFKSIFIKSYNHVFFQLFFPIICLPVNIYRRINIIERFPVVVTVSVFYTAEITADRCVIFSFRIIQCRLRNTVDVQFDIEVSAFKYRCAYDRIAVFEQIRHPMISKSIERIGSQIGTAELIMIFFFEFFFQDISGIFAAVDPVFICEIIADFKSFFFVDMPSGSEICAPVFSVFYAFYSEFGSMVL